MSNTKISGPVQLQLFDWHQLYNQRFNIFLDLDGVIVDLASRLEKEMKILFTSPKYVKKISKYPEFNLQEHTSIKFLTELFINKDYNIKLTKMQKVIRSATYVPLMNNQQLWSSLEPYQGAQQFVEWLTAKWNVTILTAPVDEPSIQGKEQWLIKHFPELAPTAIYQTEKWLHASPYSILIDDRPKNIRKWTEEGGIGILHKNYKETVQKLKEITS